MYNENTILTSGKYQFVSIKRVPAEYLITIYRERQCKDPELREYIKNNMKALEARRTAFFEPPPIDDFPCTKIVFPNERDAKDEIRRIARTRSEKKPVRCYECPHCGGWHMTSKPLRKKI